MSYSKTALPYSPKTDIYAIGLILDDMSNCLVNKEDVGYKSFKGIITSMIERNPEDRITVNDALEALKNISRRNNDNTKNITPSNLSIFKSTHAPTSEMTPSEELDNWPFNVYKNQEREEVANFIS